MSNVNRRQPTRSVRTSTTRPSNYYARPFGYRGSISANIEPESLSTAAPGFFPAITHFADGLAALPKEVMPQLTLLKETEGKVYQPDQALIELVGAVNALPPLPRQAPELHSHPFLNFSYTNSINGSASASVIDGHLPTSLPANLDNHELHSSQPQPVHEQLETRRILFRQLQEQLKVMTAVLDEKSFALNGANEALARQLSRLEKTIPYIENEVSEEARLGSNTHWALPHMKEQRKPTTVPVSERSRRDIQAANSLAAAAAAVHENDIAATRSEARREAMQAKRNRNPNVGSDFDERPASKKIVTSAKIRKPQDAAAPSEPSKGVSNGTTSTSHKRRRVEKPASLERRASVLGPNGKAVQKTELVMATADRTVVEEANRKHAVQPILVKKMSASSLDFHPNCNKTSANTTQASREEEAGCRPSAASSWDILRRLELGVKAIRSGSDLISSSRFTSPTRLPAIKSSRGCTNSAIVCGVHVQKFSTFEQQCHPERHASHDPRAGECRSRNRQKPR